MSHVVKVLPPYTSKLGYPSCLLFPHHHSCPPRSFIPALCKIFLDQEAPDNVLEVTARALTYYLDVSVECSRRITTVDGALKAIISRMHTANMDTRMSKDLVEQSVKVPTAVYKDRQPAGRLCQTHLHVQTRPLSTALI